MIDRSYFAFNNVTLKRDLVMIMIDYIRAMVYR